MSTEFITSEDLMKFKGLMNEELQKEGDLKSRYNLGYYDKVYKEGNYVKVIRKTGRYDVPINNFTVTGDHFEQSISLPNGSSLGYGTDTEYNANAISNVYKLGFYGVDKSFYVAVDNWLRIWDSSYTKDATGLAQFKAALEAAGGMYILYETTTSYTEKLPANVPINTLDQHMSNIVRDEVEKTLNLASNDGKSYTVSSGSDQWVYISGDTGKLLLNNVQYTICVYNLPSEIIAQYYDGENYYDISNSPKTFIYGNGIFTVRIGNSSVASQQIFNLKIMLNEGPVAYPYQPYNGAIVHEIQVPIYFSTTNTSPASIIGGDWTSLGSFSIGSNTVYAWRKA